MVRALLDRETESAKKGLGSQISRTNYDFVFLRQETYGVVPEDVFLIVPKRKDKNLLRGQIWVDASTFRIRRIEEVPAKSPSFWIKDIHITLQFAEVNDMWIPHFFRRHRYSPTLRAIHSRWHYFPGPRLATHCCPLVAFAQRVEDSGIRSPRAIVGVGVHQAGPPNMATILKSFQAHSRRRSELSFTSKRRKARGCVRA
jgi:hypothetical protein